MKTTLILIVSIVGVYLADKITAAYFIAGIQIWIDSTYGDFKRKPALATLESSHEIPQLYYRRIAWLSFGVIVLLATLAMTARYLMVWPTGWFVQVVVLNVMTFRLVRFLGAYRYVNEFARLRSEKIAQDQSTSSR